MKLWSYEIRDFGSTLVFQRPELLEGFKEPTRTSEKKRYLNVLACALSNKYYA